MDQAHVKQSDATTKSAVKGSKEGCEKLNYSMTLVNIVQSLRSHGLIEVEFYELIHKLHH